MAASCIRIRRAIGLEPARGLDKQGTGIWLMIRLIGYFFGIGVFLALGVAAAAAEDEDEDVEGAAATAATSGVSKAWDEVAGDGETTLVARVVGAGLGVGVGVAATTTGADDRPGHVKHRTASPRRCERPTRAPPHRRRRPAASASNGSR